MKTLLMTLFTLFLMQNISIAQDGKPYKILGKWLGDWKGNLLMCNTSGKTDNIAMELKINETDTARVWNWEIIYGEGEKRDVRSYLLREVDFQKGLFILDENNSILLDFFCKDFNTFYCTFSVEGNFITTEYRLENAAIYFKLISSYMNSSKISEETGNDSTLIYSYPVKAIHTAALTRY